TRTYPRASPDPLIASRHAPPLPVLRDTTHPGSLRRGHLALALYAVAMEPLIASTSWAYGLMLLVMVGAVWLTHRR
ncbi:MAG TPA: hypothetical protein VK871_04755, partial [Candidatus Limnocylindrales bacterium]|nr:hypothetical protein [Candidatus Limnocylindrales bacterium]